MTASLVIPTWEIVVFVSRYSPQVKGPIDLVGLFLWFIAGQYEKLEDSGKSGWLLLGQNKKQPSHRC